jgi:hypothetical protein
MHNNGADLNNDYASKPSFWRKYQFYILLIIAIVFRQIPIISIPFNWLETYFHEISHGIAALVTGGNIVSIELFVNGAGLCTTEGGIRFFITFFGYAGATIWGWAIYKLAGAHQRVAQAFSLCIAILFLCSIIFWAKTLLTIFIFSVLAAIFIFMSYLFFKKKKQKQKQMKFLQTLIQFFGLVVLLNSLISPFYLLDGRNLGDGATLASLTFLPEIVWVAIWFVFALFVTYSLSGLKGQYKISHV